MLNWERARAFHSTHSYTAHGPRKLKCSIQFERTLIMEHLRVTHSAIDRGRSALPKDKILRFFDPAENEVDL